MIGLDAVRAQEIEALTAGAPRNAKQAIHGGAISIETLREMTTLRDGRSLRDVAAAVLSFVAVPVVYGLWPHPLVLAACLLLVIRNANYFAQLVHESDHGTLFRNTRLNVWAGNLAAFILGYTRSGHRHAHMDHHLYLNTERDPDRLFGAPGDNGRRILWHLLQDLFFVTAVKRLLQYSPADRSPSSVAPWKTVGFARFVVATSRRMLPVACVQLVILGLFTVTTGPWGYLWLQLLPLMTLYPVQIRIRSAAEHGMDVGRPETPGDPWISRSSTLNVFERFVIAPMDQNYHYEHHIFPSIPNYNLARVHDYLIAAGVPVPTQRSYIGFTLRKILADFR